MRSKARGAVRRARAVADRWRRTRWTGPILSIVVPVYNVEQYLDECLWSLRRQYHRRVQIVIVDDGSPDGSLAIAQRHANNDRRIVVVQRENGGLSAARNTGIEHATGRFLTFVDSDDAVHPGGYKAAIRSLRQSGSDFAICPYERLRGRTRQTPLWIGDLYARPRRGVTIATDPDLLVHATAWSKVYRRSFWDGAGPRGAALRFTEGVLYEDQDVTASAHVAAKAVDVVTEPTYVWRHRAQSITREFSGFSMHGFMDAVDTSLDILDAVPGARRERARQVLSNDMPHYVRALPRVADSAYADALFERLPQLLAEVEPGDLQAEAPAEMRVAFALIDQGRIDDLHHFLNHDGLDVSAHETAQEAAGPSAHLPFWGDDRIDPATFVLSDRQTVADAIVLRSRLDTTGVDLVVWAYLRHLDGPEPATTTFRWVDADGGVMAELAAERSDETVGHHLRAVRESNERALWRVRGPWPQHRGPLRLEITVEHLGRTRTTIVEHRDPESSAALAQTGGGWTLDATGPWQVRRGETQTPVPTTVVVNSISVDESGVRITFDGLVPDAVELTSPRVDLAGEITGAAAVVPLTAPARGADTGVAPVGDYRLRATVRGRIEPVTIAPEVLLRAPETFRLVQTRGRLVLDGRDLVVRIDKPRTDLEQTVWGQRRLRRAYQVADVVVDPKAALLQCYGAEVATDSPLALHEELWHRDPSWTLWWGVVDHSVWLPEGAVPLIAGTEAWYDAMARAGLLVKNIELPAYLVKRPGQIHVQTFHGQPFKSMGRALWGGQRGWPEWRVAYECVERRSSRWDLIISPHAEGTTHYCEQFDYVGSVFELGMPRTDSLLATDADEVRTRTRELLGIWPDQTAVLHAATWRDDRASGPMGSRDVDHLDVESLARELGDGFVVLQRSHGSVARTNRRHGDRAGVVDVTDHPEINDLVLASDVAVLDYSSLRFDYAVTGKPMVFFVPDLAEYEGTTRGFLFPYQGTAPGPWVTTQATVLDALRSLDTWPAEHAEAYREFTERFNAHHDGHAAARLAEALDQLAARRDQFR